MWQEELRISLLAAEVLMGCEQPPSFHPHGSGLGAGVCDSLHVLASGEQSSSKEQGEPQDVARRAD